MFKAKLLWRERRSDSRFVESVWTCTANAVASRTAIADPCISIAFIKEKTGTHVAFIGPRTKPRNVILSPGYSCVTIRLKSGVSIKNLPTRNLTDTSLIFPADDRSQFQLGEAKLRFPDFDHAELLIDQLHVLGLLGYRRPTDHMQNNHLSSRTHARRTERITGLSPYRLYQLQRIHQALRLLKQGVPAAKVAAELAFVDQSHLVRASKQFFGRTPKDLPDLPQTP